MKKPLVLCILDGVGINEKSDHNAVAIARTPFLDKLLLEYPNSSLDASGIAVGLPAGTMGNSEVGHIAIGAGRIVDQFLRRFEQINFEENAPFQDFIKKVKDSGGIVHISGLMSDGLVHSSLNDIIIVMRKILESGLKVCIHFISDGRDVAPKSANGYINQINQEFSGFLSSGDLFYGSISGRYFAMDRNSNNDRTEMAFNAIANASAKFYADNINDALTLAYNRGETDEFISPTVIKSGAQPISKNDGFLFVNYRSDRARQIMHSIIKTDAHILCFSQYGDGLDAHCPALLDNIPVLNTLGDVLAANGRAQLRIAETEKYNHVTYFFDGERKIDFADGKKILIPSPDVATFDLAPEMSAPEITKTLIPKLSEYDVIILNYANADMLGHTAIAPAVVNAIECLDAQLSKLVPAVLELGGTLLITADHGNAEKLWDEITDVPWTAHTTNRVNFIVVSNEKHTVSNGRLSDIAPTILKLLGIDVPTEMTGHSLVS